MLLDVLHYLSKDMQCAKDLLSFLTSNASTDTHRFVEYLSDSLNKCLPSNLKNKRDREVMWNKFHLLRISIEFIEKWKEFLSLFSGITTSPVLYQLVTTEVFKRKVKAVCSSSQRDTFVSTMPTLSGMEEGILRYVAGYVCRRLREKLERSSNPLKDEMIIYLMEMSGDEMFGRDTEDWLNQHDRNGLWHMDDTTYELFLAIEDEVRLYYNTHNIDLLQSNVSKHTLAEKVLHNDDVLFQWMLASTEHEPITSRALLEAIVDFYITIRGFSFTDTFMEQYKQLSDKCLERSKPLRKSLSDQPGCREKPVIYIPFDAPPSLPK